MPFSLASRRRKTDTLRKQHPDARIIDLTSKAPEPWVRFSPFYPHGGIPVPNSQGVLAESVEGIWQGLKVFEQEDIDQSKFHVKSMRGIKRSSRSRGRVLGHRFGVGSDELLGYREARFRIYLPCYRWVLENRLQEETRALAELAEKGSVVLLDYETNADVNDLSKPLSHASLVIAFLEGSWPGEG